MPAATGAQLTCFPGDFLASHLALPGSAEAIRMTVRSGLKCSALLMKSDPVGLLVKTLLASPRWASTACYLTWKRRVTPARQFYYQLAVSAPRTVGTDFGFLPTPTACLHNDQEDVNGWLERRERVKLTANNGNGMGMPLAIAVKLLPTPDASLATGGKLTNRETVSDSGRTANGSKRQISLPDRLRRLLPTPTTNDQENASLPESQRNRDGLAGSILRGELLPTPTAQLGKHSAPTEWEKEHRPAHLHVKAGGSLNPRFVSEMMGYPASYCELQPTTIQWTELS